MRHKKLFFALYALLLLICHADLALAENEELHEDETFIVNDVATYKSGGKISERAEYECGMDRSVPTAIVKSAQKFKMKASLRTHETVETASSKIVSMEIDDITAGRAGNGVNGRWVESEIGVMITLKRGSTEIAHKYFSCSTGLGVIFTNITACGRLEKCSGKIGARAVKWLSSTANEAE